MTAEAIITVSAAVVACVQLAKWSGLTDKLGPWAVLILSAFGVGLWGYSIGTFERTQVFGYFAAWITVATSAAGVFGFTRSAPAAVTALKSPPATEPGAGSSPTLKS